MRKNATAALLAVFAFAGCETQILRQQNNDPDYEPPAFRAARERFELRDFDGAVRLYHEVLRENPDMARAHFNLGLIYDERYGDHISAIYHYRHFLRLKPDSPEASSVIQWIKRAELAFAAQLPNSPIENKEEFTKLQRENMQMHSDLIDARRQIAKLQSELQTAIATRERLEQRLAAVNQETARPSAPSHQTHQSQSAVYVASEEHSPILLAQTPTNPSKATTTPPPVGRRHNVQSGETLFSIARAYYPDRPVGEAVRILLEANANQLSDANKLRPGMTLTIP